MISIENISVTLDGHHVLQNVNFKIDQNQIVVLAGKNGVGKTVLLKCIAGLIDQYTGHITIDNKANSLVSCHENQATLIAYVFQKGGLFDSMNVFDNIAFGMRRKHKSEEYIQEKITSSLKKVGLGGTQHKFPSELSGGMKKRVGLARAICMEPHIILYDDPTAGLDPVLTDAMGDLILEIRSSDNITSLVVTHDLTLIEKIADEVILLHDGSIVFKDSAASFFSLQNGYAAQFITGNSNGPIKLF